MMCQDLFESSNSSESEEGVLNFHLQAPVIQATVIEDDKTDVIANDLGDRTTPCIVAFTDHDQAVGAAAKQGMIRNLQNTVCHVKQILGRRYDDPVVTEYKRKSSAQVFDQNGEPRYEVDFKESRKVVSPSQIAVSIYKKMLETAQSHGGSGIQDSVLAVPTHFTAEQKKAISSAANQAGFNILRLITEPSAAALAYDIGQNDSTYKGQVLVFRLGGLSAEVSVVNVHNGMYQILTSFTDATLGGDLFTGELVKYLAAEFKRKNKNCDISDNKRAMAKLHLQADSCKHSLSKMDNAHCAVDSLYEGIDFDTKVSRARFESCVSELVQRCTQLIDQVITEGKLTRKSIDKVILCGGGSNVPVLQKAINEMFSHCDILNSISPEEVIAIGAAKQAGILSALEDEDIKLNTEDRLVDCISKQIVIRTKGENGVEITPVFPALSPLHSRKHLEFLLNPDQTAARLEICEMRSEDDIAVLAKIVMRDLPAGSKINSTFHLRKDGHLHITCTEATSNKTESVTVEPS